MAKWLKSCGGLYFAFKTIFLRCVFISDFDEESIVLISERTVKRLNYKIKRLLKPQEQEQQPKKTATLADVKNKLQNYEKTQGPANFTGPTFSERATDKP